MSVSVRLHDLPKSVLFACNLNAVRSPMAAALLRHMSGGRIRVESCGIRIGHINAFAIAVMDEIGIDLTDHQSKQFDDLADAQFDLVVSLTPEAHHHAVELTGGVALETVYWPTMDPVVVTGSRDQILHAFRQLRDDLMQRVTSEFHLKPPPNA